jgi:glycosyltransferase involved in cell wall biosynthesis
MKIIVNGANLSSPGVRLTGLEFIRNLTTLPGNHDYHIAASEDLYKDLGDVKKRATVRKFNVDGRFHYLKRLKFEYFDFPRMVKKTNADAVIVLGNLAAARTDATTIVLLRNPYFVNPELRSDVTSLSVKFVLFVQRLMFKRTLRNAQIIVVQNGDMKKRLKETYGSAVPAVHVIPNAISDVYNNHRGNTQPQYIGDDSTASSALTLLYPSRIYLYKNHDMLIELAELIRDNDDLNYKLRVTVDENLPLGAKFTHTVRSRGLTSIIENIGEVTPSDLVAEYLASDGMIFPSNFETFGNPMLEAMCLDVPVVAAERPYARAISNDAAEYFEPDDLSSVVDALLRFKDKDRRDDLVKLARARATEFPSWSQVVTKYIDLLEENGGDR